MSETFKLLKYLTVKRSVVFAMNLYFLRGETTRRSYVICYRQTQRTQILWKTCEVIDFAFKVRRNFKGDTVICLQ